MSQPNRKVIWVEVVAAIVILIGLMIFIRG
jgi:hypothetical protein